MGKIIGNTTATPYPQPDWARDDTTKPDYIKNKPTLGSLASKNEVALGDLATGVQEAIDKAIPTSQKGAVYGVATLDENGHVPSTQLPSYVDDVIEGYAKKETLEIKNQAGEIERTEVQVTEFHTVSDVDDQSADTLILAESGKIYLDLTTLTTYRWSGTLYAQISESLALGETQTTAYYGDKGKEAHDLASKALPRSGGTMTGTLYGNNGIELIANASSANNAQGVTLKNGTYTGRMSIGGSGGFGVYSDGDIFIRPRYGEGTGYGVKMTKTDMSPTTNASLSLGTSKSMQYNNIYGKTIYQNGKQVANKDDVPNIGYATPEAHGAIGDGVNDDTSAFINAINESDYIVLTSDLYLLTPVEIAGKTRLVIDGNGYTINFKNIERALQITDSANIVFRNIIFDGNSCTTQGVLFINCENIQVEKCMFKNMTASSAADGDTWGLSFRDSKNMRVDFCSFINIDGSNNSSKVANGIVVHGHTKPCENVTISNCYFNTILPVNDGCGITFSQTSFYDTPLYGVVENCFFVDCAKRALKIMAQYVTANHCNIVDVLSNEQHSALIDIMASHCRVTNNTINVNKATNGISCQYIAPTSMITGFSDIIIENNYIEVANGDNITARDGLSIGIVDDLKKYTELVVKNNVVKGRFRYAFKAMNIADSVIEGNIIEGESRVGNRYLNDRPCENIHIVNNTLKGTFEASVTHSLLAHNTFTGGGFGIYFPTYINGNPSNLRIVGNKFDTLDYGIDGRRQAMDNIIIAENIFTNITAYDMHLLGTNYVLADNVLCKGTAGTFAIIPGPLDAHISDESNPHKVTAEQTEALPISGGTMEGEIAIGQDDGNGIQLGEKGRINATTSDKTTTRTVVGTGINSYAEKDEFTLGSPLMHTAIRGSSTRPTYQHEHNQAKEMALIDDVPSKTKTLKFTYDDDTTEEFEVYVK